MCFLRFQIYRLLERIPGEYDVQTEKLPFNRHKRRQLRLAKTVVINLFSGEDLSVWKKYEKPGVEFLHLDILKGGDLLRNQHLAGGFRRQHVRGGALCG